MQSEILTSELSSTNKVLHLYSCSLKYQISTPLRTSAHNGASVSDFVNKIFFCTLIMIDGYPGWFTKLATL